MAWVKPQSVAHILTENHYLGPINRGLAWHDRHGVIVVSSPTSRMIPGRWLELSRWCITSREKNSGSMQWSAFIRALRAIRPDVTTVVSYSDPSVGHTGSLYRACNWLWAPTWHRLRPPPTGNGAWTDGSTQSVNDRWVFPVANDNERAGILLVKDASVLKRYPWAVYAEPHGVPFKRFVAEQQAKVANDNRPAEEGVA